MPAQQLTREEKIRLVRERRAKFDGRPTDTLEPAYPGGPVQMAPSNAPVSQGGYVKPGQEAAAFPGLDATGGAPIGVRAASGLLQRREQEFEYLRRKYGEENVFPVGKQGDIRNFVIHTDNGPVLFDPQASSVLDFVRDLPGDVADVIGEVVESAPGAIASGAAAASGAGLAGAIPAGVTGDALGTVMRAGLAEAFTGEKETNLGPLMLQNAAFGVAGEAAGAIGRPISAALGRNAGLTSSKLARLGRQGAEELPKQGLGIQEGLTGLDAVKRSAALVERVRRIPGNENFHFTVGQHTGIPSALGTERLLRQFGKTAGQVQTHDQASGLALDRFIKSAADHVAENPDRLGRTNIGKSLGNALKTRADLLASQMREANKANYKAAFDEAISSGNVNVISTSAAQENIRRFITSKTSDLDFDYLLKIVDDPKKMREAIPAERNRALVRKMLHEHEALDKNTNAVQLQNLLQEYGERARGAHPSLSDTTNTFDMAYDKAVLGGLQRDLDNAIAQGAAGSQKLRYARDTTREFRKEIDTMGTAEIQRIFKLDDASKPEEIVKFMANLDPTPLKGALDVIDSTNPLVGKDLRAQLLLEWSNKNAGKRANIGQQALLDSDSPFSVFKSLSDNTAKIKAIFGDNPAHMAKVRDAIDLSQKLSNTLKLSGAQTAVLANEAQDLGLAGHPVMMVTKMLFGDGVFGQARLAEIMTSEDGIRLYLDFLRKASTPRKTERAATAAKLAADRMLARIGLVESTKQVVEPEERQ